MSRMSRHDHGGLCCGIKHLQGFGQDPLRLDDDGIHLKRDRLDTFLEEWAAEEAAFGPGNRRVLEVVLTDRQEAGWRPTLLEKGFQKVYRFYNSNSRNHCNYYVKHADGIEVFDPQHESPPLPAAVAAQPVAAPAPRPIAVGDRVRYIGDTPNWQHRRGQEGVVTNLSDINRSAAVLFDDPAMRGDMTDTVIAVLINLERIGNEEVAAPAVNQADPRVAELEAQIRELTQDRRNLQTMNETQSRTIVSLTAERDAFRRNLNEANGLLEEAQQALTEAQNRPIELAVIFSDYYADLQRTGRKGPFSVLQEVRERYPLCRNIQRRNIFNDGTIEFERVR